MLKIFTFETFERGTKCQLGIWKVFIMSVYTSVEKLSNIHELDQFDFC